MNPLYEFRLRRVRRAIAKDAPRTMHNSAEAAALFRGLIEGEAREVLMVASLNVRNHVLGIHKVAIGTVSNVECAPREIFQAAILVSASAIVMAHNHPSGDPEPSIDDHALSLRIREAGELMGIPLLDSVVVTETSHVSLGERLGWASKPTP